MCTKTAPEPWRSSEIFQSSIGSCERVYDYWVRDKVIPVDGAMTVPGMEVMIDIFEPLGEVQGQDQAEKYKYIDLELLSRARKRLQ